MCWPLIIAGASALMMAKAQKDQGDAESAVQKKNAILADMQAEQARNIGTIDEERQMAVTRQLLGRQRATFAANNIDASSGSALDTIGQTAQFGAMDAMTVRNNALRQAWGFDVEASNARNAAAWAKYGSRQKAAGTLLSGAGSVYGKGADAGYWGGN